jgi:hypothetical protein
MTFFRRLSLLALVVVPFAARAQKKVLTQADWDRWRSIQGATLSNDGKWLAYTLSPQVGDGEFVVRSTTGTQEYRVPVGYIGRPNNTPGGERAGGGGGGRGGRGGRGGGGGGAGGPFTADGRYAFVTTQPARAEVERQQRTSSSGRGAGGRGGAGGGGAAANQNTIVRITLADGTITPMKEMRSYRLSATSGKWMIYVPADSSATRDSAATGGGRAGRGGGGGGGARGAAGGGGGAPRARRSYGSTIVLRNLDTNADERLTDVSDYEWDDSTRILVYTVASRDSTKDGIYVRDLASGTTKTILSGPGNYRSFSFDDSQQQYTFVSDRDEFGRENARSAIYYGTLKGGTPQAVVKADMLPPDMRFPQTFGANFTRAGNALTFNIAPPEDDTIPADSLVGKAKFDLWHWKDPQLQTQQLLQVNQARNRTYQAIYDLSSKKVVRLTTDSFPSVNLSADAKVGLQSTGVAYSIERMWGEGGNDVYLIDPSTGARRLVRRNITGNAQLSPDAKYVIFYHDMEWYTYNIATGKEAAITSPYPSVHWEQETFSTPDDPSAWGIAGWTKGDRSVLINDRFDIWELDPAGVRPAVVLTDSLGRRENITFRIMQLERDPDERYIDPSKSMWLSAFDEDTKESGFYKTTFNSRHAPARVTMDPVRYGNPTKARDANVYMYTKSTFTDFPNVYVGNSVTTGTRLTDANPWQKEYNWGTAELVDWISMDGVPRQGILYKPENFDPKKKYPMISYFYEDLSDGLYGYVAPNGRNVINATHYVSNGYLVFEPDIYYEMGHPGASAVKSIVPGVQKIMERGYVDPKGLGLQGQSWGGYQTAYLITQTTMFSAAMAGAPVANMTSAYGGIRWGSGLNRSMQYEHGQSRIGQSLWEAPQLYIENSPLFHLERVTTPLFIMSNDRDDAVPWYQGIEMFIGMRRLGKEAYLINYNNDVHNPASRANQKDIAMRMQQFFDNKLKGAPMPDWMAHGIPAKDKGKDQIITPVIRQ